MTNLARLLSAMVVTASLFASASASADLRILYAEPLQIAGSLPGGVQKPGFQTSARITAFGRTFDLVLEDNSTLLRRAPARVQQKLESLRLLRGTVRDIPGSWVRLTLKEGAYEGALWDGSELYAIASRQVLEPALLTPLATSSASSAIYRLSDTQGTGTQSCGVATDAVAVAPVNRYRKLIDELKSVTAAAAGMGEIEVAVVADFEATSRWGATAETVLIERMNVVDGIFSTQVGVAIVPTDFIIHATDADPFSGNDAVTLLQQFADYRSGSTTVGSRGLAHLFTGRQLDGTTVGIAFLGALCKTREGAGLTEASPFIDSALVTAHEIGHNFGASHDNETGSPCSSEPLSYLMAPTLNGSSTFSQCSVQTMQPYIAAASCITSSRVHDVGVSAPADEVQPVVNRPFEFVADIAATGDSASRNVLVSGALPFGTTIDSVSLEGAVCSTTPGPTGGSDDVNCMIGTLEAGQSRRLRINARFPSVGQRGATIRVSASNDANPGNNSKTVRINVAAEQDLRIVATPQPFVATLGEPFDMAFDLTANGIQAVAGLRVEIGNALVQAQSAEVAGGTCTIATDGSQVTCEAGSLAAGETRRVVVRGMPTTMGTTVGGTVRAYQQADPSWFRFIHFQQDIRAAWDVSARIAPGFRRAAIGEAAEWTLEVRSNGVYDSSNVSVRLDADSAVAFTIDDAAGGTCTAAQSPECNLGTVAAGTVRTIRFRTRADVALESNVTATIVQSAADDQPSNDVSTAFLNVSIATDVQLQYIPANLVLYDGRSSQLFDTFVRATGAYAADRVSLSVTLPAEFEILSAALGETICTVRSAPQSGVDCSLPRLEPGNAEHFWLAAIAPAPGVYSGTVTVTADDDSNPANNSTAVTLDVRPAVDGLITAPEEGPAGSAGTQMETVFMVDAGRYALPDARVQISWSGPFSEIAASWPGGTCSRNTTHFMCELGTIEPDAIIPVTVRFTAAQSSPASLNAYLSSMADTDTSNNAAYMSFYVYLPADVSLTAASSSLQGQLDTYTSLNLTVATTPNQGANTSVEFSFDPAQVQDLIIGEGACRTTTFAHRCDIGLVETSTPIQIGATVRPKVTGAVRVTVRMRSTNDTTAGNNEQVIVINVDPPPAPPPPPPPPSSDGGGAGGGGAISLWMMLALLAVRGLKALAVRRHVMRKETRGRFYDNVTLRRTSVEAAGDSALIAGAFPATEQVGMKLKFTPDGSRVLFDGHINDWSWPVLRTTRVDGSAGVQIISSLDSQPYFSIPDFEVASTGRHAAFTSQTGFTPPQNPVSSYVVDLEQGTHARIGAGFSIGDRVTTPVFSVDGTRARYLVDNGHCHL